MIQFGDIRIICQMARRIPHIEECGHECNCEYCEHGEDAEFRCSECRYETDMRSDFEIIDDDYYLCPNPRCKAKLLEEDDVRRIEMNKRKAYTLSNK